MPTSLVVTAECLEFLELEIPEMIADLRKRATVEVGDFSAVAAPSPLGVAKETAELLRGQICSSDADVPFFACVVRDLTDDPWTALGTTKDEQVKLSGWENPRLDRRVVDPVQAFANLNDDNFASVDEYVVADDQKAFASAGDLLKKHGEVTSYRLAFPEESVKLVLTVANGARELPGVLSLSVET